MRLILATSSPRRKDVFTMLGYEFTAIPSNIDETESIDSPVRLVEQLAYEKAKNVFDNNRDACVVGSDTVVFYNGEIIGKPKDEQDAFRILSLLRGSTHTVYTGLCVLCGEKQMITYDTTLVKFSDFTDAEIWSYIKTGEPLDKAGAYGIQGPGGVLVEKVDGCYFTVIGMPVNKIYSMLKDLGITPNWQ